MDLRLTGKTALITGASQGIGRAIAEELAAEGCNLILLARNQDNLDSIALALSKQYQVKVLSKAVDLANPPPLATLLHDGTTVDILVNNAGAIPAGTLGALSDEEASQAMNLKMHAYIALAQHCFREMSARKSGVILNIIGTAGERPRAKYALGSMVNASLIAMTRALGLEGMEHGVRVVGLHPGATKTDRKITQLKARAAKELSDACRWQELVAKYPYGRLAEPEEIAKTAVFLCSPIAAYINATCITVDGGATDSMV